MHTPLSRGGRSGLRRSGTAAGCGTFRAFFLPFPGRSGPGDTPSCLPYYGERGRCKKKAGAVKKAGFGRGSTALPVQGFCPWTGRVSGEACGRERRLRKRSGPCPGRAAIAAGRAGSPSRQKAARHRKRAPEDRGPCRRWSVRPSGLGHTR